jgi:flagellar biosynthesis/type III secretory pathway M-ring protein FliF/YscJ
MINYLSIILVSLSAVLAQNPSGVVNTDGFRDQSNDTTQQQESWLKKNDRYIFIIFLVLLFLAILIWYVVRSIRSMRQRLASENQGHMMMIQNVSGGQNNTNHSGFSETVPIDNNGFHKMPDYPGPPQQQQQYTHRY